MDDRLRGGPDNYCGLQSSSRTRAARRTAGVVLSSRESADARDRHRQWGGNTRLIAVHRQIKEALHARGIRLSRRKLEIVRGPESREVDLNPFPARVGHRESLSVESDHDVATRRAV